ncbi:uncharacterized protein LOC135148307 [Daucus carota subsp. sativus]|uniref:uncharacterized protein LOC135148307 n=1 Tax=Daucus carota subsp. sativus TaxID=79200 RepID=UPI0030839127
MNPIRFLPDCFRVLKAVKSLVLSNCNQLQILEDLPETEELWAVECRLLEKITLKPGLLIKGYDFPYKCEKLLEMESLFKVVPIDEIDPDLINNCGIYDVESMKTIQIRLYNSYTFTERRCPVQGVHENRHGHLFSIFYPGSSVPIWFSSRSYMPSLSFIISHSKLRYLNTCIVYKLNGEQYCYFYLISHNKTKDQMIVHRPGCYGIPEGDECMTWLCHWKFSSHEAGPGDEINVSMYSYYSDNTFKVKEIGIHLVYEEQEQAGVPLAKRQKMEHTSDKSSQCVVPMGMRPLAHHGTTRLYFVGCGVTTTNSWVERYFGKYVETGEPSSSDIELD